MITFYTNRSGGPIVDKITIMLNETSSLYTAVPIDMQNDKKLMDDLSKVNPNGSVPAIKDAETGTAVFESAAILYYLAEKNKMFLPEALKDRTEVIKWLMFEAANLGPMMGELYYYMLKTLEEISDTHLQRYKDNVDKCCAILDRQLDQADYLCGDYSIADINIYPWSVLLVDLAEINLDKYANLTSWITRISNRPAVKNGAI